jgi:nucleotide-binding universal stress UspA family protein
MGQVRKILVPTDFSTCAAAALDRAAEFAKRFEAEILLLHVVTTLAGNVAFPELVPLPHEWLESTRKLAKDHVAKEARRIKGPVIHTEVREGTIHESILASASDAKADMIVIGTHGRSGFKHALLGSVAERVVRSSPVPVLTVRTPA